VDITFIRPRHDWEVEMVFAFFNLLYSLRISQGSEDRICWTPFKKKTFEVRSIYHALSPPAGSSSPWKSIWRNKAPPRVAFFVLITALGNILTLDNLRKRYVIVIDWCCMCKKSGESINHLLLHCDVVKSFVGICFQSFWGRVGHVTMGGGVVGLLEGSV
jgi:hypothetical protein